MPYEPNEWPLHPNEARRLELLHSFDVLDTQCERSFDRITELTQMMFNVPICLISLVAEDRQWFKSCIGLDTVQTCRDAAFCAHAILPQAPDIFIVEDAKLDLRFCDNPLVTGEPFIRSVTSLPVLLLKRMHAHASILHAGDWQLLRGRASHLSRREVGHVMHH